MCEAICAWPKEAAERQTQWPWTNNHTHNRSIAEPTIVQFDPRSTHQRKPSESNPGLIKGSWTREEDEIIVNFVKQHGTKNWTKLATLLPGRIGKQCRERWRNHLDPEVNRSPWTEVEDEILINLHETLGNQWVKIAESLPGRSDNAIKNRWNSTLKKQLESIRTGTPRKKRGRPARTPPKSADDVPKPPRLDELIPPEAQPKPRVPSPYAFIRSPFGSMSPFARDDLGSPFMLFSPMSGAENSNDVSLFSPFSKM